MPKIEKIKWGNVWIDGQKYHQAIISNGKVFEREKEKLEKLFGTTHKIGDWEEELLFAADPEIILISTGFDNILKVSPDYGKKVSQKGIQLQTVLTDRLIENYNKLVKLGKKINVLIHTTC